MPFHFVQEDLQPIMGEYKYTIQPNFNEVTHNDFNYLPKQTPQKVKLSQFPKKHELLYP